MINALHDLDFPSDGFLSLNVFHLFLLVDFQSDFRIWLIAHTKVHKCISTLANLLTDRVFIQIMIIRENDFFFLYGRHWFLFSNSCGLLCISFRLNLDRLFSYLLSNLSRLTITWRFELNVRNRLNRFGTNYIVFIALNLVHDLSSISFITNISQCYVCSARW